MPEQVEVRSGAGARIVFDAPEPHPAILRVQRWATLQVRVRIQINAWRARRSLREARLALEPGWIDSDPPTFIFPSWCPRWRPYDHTIDPDQLERIT